MTKKKTPLWTGNLIGILLINVLIYFGWQVQLSTLPIYLQELSGSDAIVGVCAAIGTLAAVMIRPVAGFALDRVGRRSVLLIGVTLMLGTTLLYQWFPIVGAVIAIRFLFGLGWGISTTSSNTIAADVVPKERFAEGMGYFSLAQSTSLALAPAIGLSILATTDFYGLTMVAAGMLFIIFIVSFFLRYHKVEKKKTKFVPYERSAIRPSIIIIFVSMGIGAVLGFVSLYGKSKGYENVGLFFTFLASALLVTRPLTGRLIDRFGFNAVVYPGFIGFIISVFLLFVTNNEVAFLTVGLLQGITYGAVVTSLQTMAVVNAPAYRRGAANATFFTGFDIGQGLGNLSAGVLSGIFGYGMMYGLMTIPLFIGAVLYFLIARKTKVLRESDTEDTAALEQKICS